jgi:hypothetical protein
MKLTSKRGIFCTFFAVILLLLMFGFSNVTNLAFATEINFDLPADVQITQLNYFLKDLGGQTRLFVHLTVKNLSDTPKRYRVLLSAPGGSQVGGFVPRKASKKGMKPVIQPNNEYTEKFYFAKDQIAEKLSIRIATFE